MVGASSLLGNTNLITKVYFPKLIIPSAAVFAAVVDFAIASVLLVALLIYYGYGRTLEVLLLLPISLLITTLALGMGILFFGLECQVSGCSICPPVPASGMDVHHADNIPGECRAEAMAVAAGAQSINRDRRSLSRLTICSADTLAVPCLFAAFYCHAPFLRRLHL